MRTTNFNGETLPVIGLGTWHMGSDRSRYLQEQQALRTGIEHGATLIDTAEMYGEGDSEKLVGSVLPEFNRESLFIISKFYPQNATVKRMAHSLEQSLQRLGTDYLDLYLYHWRGNVPLAETIEGMKALKKAGKIRHWGVSNFDVVDLVELEQIDKQQEVFANEVLYNLGNRGIDYDLMPWQQKRKLPLIAYSPIAQGDSLGKQLTQQPVIQTIAQTHQMSPFQILLAWTIQQPHTLAIPQSSNEAHVLANIAAGDLALSEMEMAAIDEIYPKPTSKHNLDVL